MVANAPCHGNTEIATFLLVDKEKGSDPVYKLNTWTLLTPRPLYKINDADENLVLSIYSTHFLRKFQKKN